MLKTIFYYTVKLLGNISGDHGLLQASYNMSNQRLERIHYILSLNLMKIPLYWSVEIELHLGQRQIYIVCYIKQNWKEIFLTWYKYKKTAQTGKQESTHNPGF